MDKIRIGLIGYGYWGPNVAKNIYKNDNFDFVKICDKKKERIDVAKELYVNALEYTYDYNELLSDNSIDAVAIAVETKEHYRIAKEALLSGKHVYIEKPFTDNCKQAIKLKQIAEEQNLCIHVDHIMVYHPAIKHIKKIVDSRELGKIIYFDCSRINLGKIKNDVSSMWDLSVHDLSIIDYLTNGEQPRKISALGKKMYSSKQSTTFLNLDYGDFIANIRSSWLSPIKERRIIVAGTKKMIVYDDMKSVDKMIIYNKGFECPVETFENIEYEEYAVKIREGDAIIPYIDSEDALYNSLEEFCTCIKEKRESKTNADAAVRILEILEEADKQMK